MEERESEMTETGIVNVDGPSWGGRIRTSDWLIQNQPSQIQEPDSISGANGEAGTAGIRTRYRDSATVVRAGDLDWPTWASYWQELDPPYRRQFLKSDERRPYGGCYYCGRTTVLTVDHLVPRVVGGSDLPDNIVLACAFCNSSKGRRTEAQFRTVRAAENESMRRSALARCKCGCYQLGGDWE